MTEIALKLLGQFVVYVFIIAVGSAFGYLLGRIRG